MKIETARKVFLALYYNQDIFEWSYPKYCARPGYTNRNTEMEKYSHAGRLVVRRINQLTDEECEVIASLLKLKPNEYFSKNISNGFDRVTWVREFLSNFANASFYGKASDLHSAIQYTRQIGIILPFTYIDDNNKPVTLTAEDMYDLGWIKYKENEFETATI